MVTNVPYELQPRAPGMLETTTTMMAGESHTHRRISWAAILGGVILVVTVQLLFSLLGAGIGLDTVNINAGTTPNASSIGIGAARGGSSAASSPWHSAGMRQLGLPALSCAGMACCTA